MNEFQSIGTIPFLGDIYYNGIIDAHNDDYFITQYDEVYPEGEENSNVYESLYHVYKMNEVLDYLLNSPQDLSSSLKVGLVLAARAYVSTLKPLGFINERNLERK